MAKLRAWDGRNYLLLTDGGISDTERFRRIVGKLARPPPIFDETDMHSSALAWALTAAAQQHAQAEGYDPGSLGLETWVIGSTTESCLRGWFADATPDSTYRVIIHREIRNEEDPSKWEDLWYHAHRRLRIRLKRRRSIHCKVGAEQLLNEMMAAYAQTPETVGECLRSKGMPYGHSYGLFSPSSSSLSSREPSRIQQYDHPTVSAT